MFAASRSRTRGLLRSSSRPGLYFLATAGVAAGSVLLAAPAVLAGNFAADVVAYAPGSAPASHQTPSAALGPISGDTGFGGANPFNPPFDASQIVLVGAGGSLSLRLDQPVAAAGGMLGVFVNNGLIDVSSDGSGQAGSPPGAFSPFPRAIVSVSDDGLAYLPLSAGPITFDGPTNAWLDSPIDNYFQPIGSAPADQGRSFGGSLTDFAGETYPRILARLNGSAGGTWLDLSSAPLTQIGYVRFDVPAGADYRMVVDSVSAVPEPSAASIALTVFAAASLRRRR